MLDVCVIGAGVIGCATARELSKRKLNIAVLEKSSDVCEGTSKANSGIVHAGFDAKPGTLMAKLNVEGSREMPELSKELDFPYQQNGAFVLCFQKEDLVKLEELKARGEKNGVKDLQILNREELLEKEPNIGEEVVAALYAPSSGIVCPFGMTIAFAENAKVNGAEFHFETEVQNIKPLSDHYLIQTTKGDFEAKTVINAAGVYADQIHNMVSSTDDQISITPRKGEYILCDKKVGNYVSHTLFQLPTILGKGILVTPTVHGNLLMGPTAQDLEEKDGVNTTSEGLDLVMNKAALSIKDVPKGQTITSFAGLRAHAGFGDFIIGEVEGAPGFYDLAGIESPGLSSAPAIAKMAAEYIDGYLKPEDNPDFIRTRKGIPNMALASEEEKHLLIKENSAFAKVVCRCEMVTEGEIIAAIHRPVGATTVDGIKRRTRAGMGRCQAGFCLPKTIEILARELGVTEEDIRKAEKGSEYFSKDAQQEMVTNQKCQKQSGGNEI